MKNLRLKQTRLKKGISQGELAKKIGYTQAYISKIENGYIKPNPYIRFRIARALGSKVSEVFPKIKIHPRRSLKKRLSSEATPGRRIS